MENAKNRADPVLLQEHFSDQGFEVCKPFKELMPERSPFRFKLPSQVPYQERVFDPETSLTEDFYISTEEMVKSQMYAGQIRELQQRLYFEYGPGMDVDPGDIEAYVPPNRLVGADVVDVFEAQSRSVERLQKRLQELQKAREEAKKAKASENPPEPVPAPPEPPTEPTEASE